MLTWRRGRGKARGINGMACTHPSHITWYCLAPFTHRIRSMWLTLYKVATSASSNGFCGVLCGAVRVTSTGSSSSDEFAAVMRPRPRPRPRPPPRLPLPRGIPVYFALRARVILAIWRYTSIYNCVGIVPGNISYYGSIGTDVSDISECKCIGSNPYYCCTMGILIYFRIP